MAANGEDPPPDVTPDVVFDEDDVAPDNQDADGDAHAPFAENVTIDGSSLNVVATFERNMSKTVATSGKASAAHTLQAITRAGEVKPPGNRICPFGFCRRIPTHGYN